MSEDRDTLGWSLVALPIVGGVVEAAVVLAHARSFAVMVTAAVCVLGTAALIEVDRRKWHQPFAHTVLACLLWVVGYPVHMWQRSRAGASASFVASLFSMLVFLGAPVLAGTFITPSYATVECARAGAGDWACTVRNERGSDAVQACWSIVAPCSDGTQSAARACQEVEPASTRVRSVSRAEFRPISCDQTGEATVEGLTVDRL